MDSIAMVEGEMKEISEAEMLKQLNLLTNTSKPNFCSTAFASCFGKKEVRTYEGEREDGNLR
jgi:polyribonucleotide nucleotidyltransferase